MDLVGDEWGVDGGVREREWRGVEAGVDGGGGQVGGGVLGEGWLGRWRRVVINKEGLDLVNETNVFLYLQ